MLRYQTLHISSSTEPYLIFRPKSVTDVTTTSPYFPLKQLKTLMMELMTQAVQKGAGHIRDPIGGSNENFFV